MFFRRTFLKSFLAVTLFAATLYTVYDVHRIYDTRSVNLNDTTAGSQGGGGTGAEAVDLAKAQTAVSEESAVDSRLSERKKKILEMCDGRQFSCYLNATLTFHMYPFHDYNATVCTIPKVCIFSDWICYCCYLWYLCFSLRGMFVIYSFIILALFTTFQEWDESLHSHLLDSSFSLAYLYSPVPLLTSPQAGSSTWRNHLRRVNKGPPMYLPIRADPRREAFLSRPVNASFGAILSTAKIITVRYE